MLIIVNYDSFQFIKVAIANPVKSQERNEIVKRELSIVNGINHTSLNHISEIIFYAKELFQNCD